MELSVEELVYCVNAVEALMILYNAPGDVSWNFTLNPLTDYIDGFWFSVKNGTDSLACYIAASGDDIIDTGTIYKLNPFDSVTIYASNFSGNDHFEDST